MMAADAEAANTGVARAEMEEAKAGAARAAAVRDLAR